MHLVFIVGPYQTLKILANENVLQLHPHFD